MTAAGDIVGRLAEKADLLDEMARKASTDDECHRLGGKAQGVRLAISFIEEERRSYREEFMRQFTGSASAIVPSDPTMQTWNAPEKSK